MGLFPIYFGYVYILLVIDYVSKWVEAKATRFDDSKVVKILSSITYSPGLEFQELYVREK